MKIAIYGAGAVGGHFAVRLARAGHDVAVVARGEALAAIRSRGLMLLAGEERLHARVAASNDPADLGTQDLVICTLKSTALRALAEGGQPLLGRDTPVIFAQNGIPWWYGHVRPSDGEQPDLGWLDPCDLLAERIGLGKAIGGVIFSSNEVVEPGVVRNDTPGHNALIVGEPDRSASERIALVRETLVAAGLASPPVSDIAETVWTKLVFNMTISVLCMITRQTAREAVEDPLFADLCPRLIGEAVAIARSQGYAVAVPKGRGTAPAHRPSLLQDFLRGRPLEIDALVAAPLAIARASGVSVPALETLGAVAKRMAADAGLWRPPGLSGA